MNLGKLLGAGKSFVSGRKSAAYRADKRAYVPQFISPKNPFANLPTVAAQSESPTPAKQNPVALARKAAPLWAEAKEMSEPMPVAKVAGPARATTWASKFSPVSIFRTAPVISGKPVSAVQVELSLEKVKVVHNDLTDADVEVVPMKSRPARSPTVEIQPAKNSWSDLGERIMKATAL